MTQDQLEKRTIILAFTTALVLTMMAVWFIIGPFGAAIAAEDNRITTTSSQDMVMDRVDVKVDEMAPDFSLPMYPAGTFKLSDHRGETVVLYFYPGDDTPVCTKQALEFRQSMDDFRAANAVVVGVSADSYDSHEAFAKKHGLPMPLLVDEGGAVREMFGMPNDAEEVQGRITYIIDGEGKVRHTILEEEDMPRHVTEALEWAERLGQERPSAVTTSERSMDWRGE
jgi:peroxiredoxin Q/BCP